MEGRLNEWRVAASIGVRMEPTEQLSTGMTEHTSFTSYGMFVRLPMGLQQGSTCVGEQNRTSREHTPEREHGWCSRQAKAYGCTQPRARGRLPEVQGRSKTVVCVSMYVAQGCRLVRAARTTTLAPTEWTRVFKT